MYSKSKVKGSARFSLTPGSNERTVCLAGDFTNWKPIPMTRQKDGSFAVKIPLQSGRHQYKFVIDGRWTEDPQNSVRVPNSYGTMNCVAQV